MTQTLKAFFLVTLLGFSLSGCVYKIEVQQGNIITDTMISQIHPGMSVAAVKQILGEPLLYNVYRGDQIYYVYTMKQGSHVMYRRNLTIYFKDDHVTHYTTDFNMDNHGKK